MLRFLLVFAAGVPAGWTVCFYSLHDARAVVGCSVASLLFLVTARNAGPRKVPEQRLERHLMGLRVVGREDQR
jgi:hypothetical protein